MSKVFVRIKQSLEEALAMTYYQLGREKAKQGKTRKQVEREYPDNHSVLIGFDDWQLGHK